MAAGKTLHTGWVCLHLCPICRFHEDYIASFAPDAWYWRIILRNNFMCWDLGVLEHVKHMLCRRTWYALAVGIICLTLQLLTLYWDSIIFFHLTLCTGIVRKKVFFLDWWVCTWLQLISSWIWHAYSSRPRESDWLNRCLYLILTLIFSCTTTNTMLPHK